MGSLPAAVTAEKPKGLSPGQRLARESAAGRRWMLAAVAAGLLAAVAGLVFLYLLSAVIAAVFIDGQALAAVMPSVVIMLVALVARGALLVVREPLAQRAASHLKQTLRDRLLAQLRALGPVYAQSERSGELVNTISGGVGAIDGWVTRYEPARLQAMIVPLLVLLLILWLDPWSTLVLLIAGPVLVILLVFIGQRTQALTERRFADLSWMSGYFLDMLRGLPTMKAFGRSREQARNIAAISTEFGRTTMDVLRTAFQTSLVLEWGATAATALVAVEVSLRLMAGALPFATALAVLLLTPEFFQPLRQLALQYHAGSEGKAAARRIYQILDQPAPPVMTGSPRELRTTVTPPEIRLEQVVVQYENDRQPALRGASLAVPAGRVVAVVGPTGAGKSTMAHLLLRFVEPADGLVLVDGRPLAELDAGQWRAGVGYVPQQPHLFAGTVTDNIRVANIDASDEAVWAAAEAANATGFIRRLPQGFDTPVGDEGVRLSGGQRQRLAIARAFLKDAPFVLLDEATANLDSVSEAAVWEALERLLVGRTALVIAHRLQLARRADLIAVVEAGQVVATGSHDDLLERCDLYRRLNAAYAEVAV